MTVRSAARIVVGVDGSPVDGPVISWAAREARRRGASIELVYALHLPTPHRDPLGLASVGVDLDLLREEARTVLAVAGSLVKDHAADVRVEVALSDGPAGQALLDAAHGAAMLVVGARHTSGLTGLVVGSITTTVLHKATCPVVVIPTPPPDGGDGVR